MSRLLQRLSELSRGRGEVPLPVGDEGLVALRRGSKPVLFEGRTDAFNCRRGLRRNTQRRPACLGGFEIGIGLFEHHAMNNTPVNIDRKL